VADFADELGPGYLNLVVRRVAQRIAASGDAYFREKGTTAAAASTAVLTYVARHDGASIADIAAALGYTHQAVAKAVHAMEKAKLVRTASSAADLRKRQVSLTREGKREAVEIDALAERAAQVFGEIFEEIGVDLFQALRDFEHATDRRPLLGRLLELDDPQRTRRIKAGS
jgi:DNA-binding MarR family transcriptional regulator